MAEMKQTAEPGWSIQGSRGTCGTMLKENLNDPAKEYLRFRGFSVPL
jgi:hypothetical protein